MAQAPEDGLVSRELLATEMGLAWQKAYVTNKADAAKKTQGCDYSIATRTPKS